MTTTPVFDPGLAAAIRRLLQQHGRMDTALITALLTIGPVLVDPGLVVWHLSRMPGVQVRHVLGADGVGRNLWVLTHG